MARSALIDTNILIYTYDRREPDKQARAFDVLNRLQKASAGYLSVKTLSEFFVVVTRQIPDALSFDEAIREMERYCSWPVLDLTPQIVIEAARGVRDHGLSYWDAQMWATARIHRLDALFSEDLATGSIIGGVSLLNPLAPAFDLEAWLQA